MFQNQDREQDMHCNTEPKLKTLVLMQGQTVENLQYTIESRQSLENYCKEYRPVFFDCSGILRRQRLARIAAAAAAALGYKPIYARTPSHLRKA